MAEGIFEKIGSELSLKLINNELGEYYTSNLKCNKNGTISIRITKEDDLLSSALVWADRAGWERVLRNLDLDGIVNLKAAEMASQADYHTNSIYSCSDCSRPMISLAHGYYGCIDRFNCGSTIPGHLVYGLKKQS